MKHLLKLDSSPPRAERWTSREVLESVSRLANHLRAQGVKKGDVVQVYMPMVCELSYRPELASAPTA